MSNRQFIEIIGRQEMKVIDINSRIDSVTELVRQNRMMLRSMDEDSKVFENVILAVANEYCMQHDDNLYGDDVSQNEGYSPGGFNTKKQQESMEGLSSDPIKNNICFFDMDENVDEMCMRSVNEDFENIVGNSTFGDIMSSMNVQAKSVLEDESGFENIGDVTVMKSREVDGSSLISRGRTKALSWSRALDLILMDVENEILMDEQNKECLDVDIMNDSSIEEHLTLFAKVS
ncbi:hypothetical protein TorRG33x02_086520 [Trema orientale]|uniref:Uncharacterized protein n=1 Tax=Trema orientale TaxID=63057 RepID=A0A2P5FCL5_TREOI|nr:hypothetical protein TorRG33x02_086520 [Trema orientale]